MARKRIDPSIQDGQDSSGAELLQVPEKLALKKGDPGVYSDDGFFGLGPGWYHFGTPDNQIFIGHSGERDFYILDFDVTTSGDGERQGKDTITEFERGVDDIVPRNSFAEISPGVSYTVQAEESGPRGEWISYTLTHLEFVEQQPVATEIAALGQVRFVDLV